MSKQQPELVTDKKMDTSLHGMLKMIAANTVKNTFMDGQSVIVSTFVSNRNGREQQASTPKVGSDEAWAIAHMETIAKLILQNGAPRP